MEQTVNMSFTKLLKRAVLYKIGEIVSAYRWQTQVFVNVHLIIIHNTTVRYYFNVNDGGMQHCKRTPVVLQTRPTDGVVVRCDVIQWVGPASVQ